MTKKHNPITEQELVDRARASVHDHQLSDSAARKLRMARRAAVAQLENDTSHASTFWGGRRWLVPAGLAATAALAVVLVGTNESQFIPLLDEQEFAAATEMELLDDIEFLAWMLEQDNEQDAPDDS